MDEKSHGNIVIRDISYKTLIGAKPLCIRFDKIDEFTRVYDGTRYLVLFGSEKYDAIYNRVTYLIIYKAVSRMFFFFYYYGKIKVDSYDSFPIERDCIIMLIFGETKVIKEKFYAAKKYMKLRDVNVDNIVISRLVKTNTNSKRLIRYLDKAIRPLVLIMTKMSGFVKDKLKWS